MNWTRTSDDLPPTFGHYLVYDEREQHMWLGIWQDGTMRGPPEGEGDLIPMGWRGCGADPKFWPTHWRPLPERP